MEIILFGKEIPVYGVCFFFGMAIAVVTGIFLIKRRGIDRFDFACGAVYIMIGAILGSKLLFVLVSWQEIVALKLSFIEILKGGFVFYGGLLGGLGGLLIYGKQFKTDITDYLDVCAVALPFGHAFGRVGCFFAGCCYGMHYDGIGSYTYTKPTNTWTPIGVPLLPIQLIEAFFLLLLFVSVLVLFLKVKRKGTVALVYSIGYALLRFVLEFFRGDVQRGLFFYLSTSQWISLLILWIALWICGRLIKRGRRK